MFTASLDVDAQRSFTPLCPNELPVPDGHNIVAALNTQAKLAKFRVGSMDIHPPDSLWLATEDHPQFARIEGHPNLDIYWNAHCIIGTEGAQLLPGLPTIEEYDFMVVKGCWKHMHPYGACYHDLQNRLSTGLIEFLKDRKIETVIVGGLATEYCVKTTALQLVKHFNVVVNLSACRAIGRPEIAVREMLQCGIQMEYIGEKTNA